MRTQEEINNLKDNWLDDPCWDIEDTEGFEDHKEELRAWRERIGAKNAEENRIRIQNKANRLQCSFALAEYVDKLECQIDNLLDRIGELEYKTS